MNCLSVFDYFLGLGLTGLNFNKSQPIYAGKYSPYKKGCMSIDFSIVSEEDQNARVYQKPLIYQKLVARYMFKAPVILSQLSITTTIFP